MLPGFGIRMELPGALAKWPSSFTLISIPIPTVMILVIEPVSARFFNKFACACNLQIFPLTLFSQIVVDITSRVCLALTKK